MTEAKRFNTGKPQLSYILDFPIAINQMAGVMEYGEKKYGDRYNWRKGQDPMKVMDSLLRHATAIQNGEMLDQESGLPHTGHMMCNVALLAEYFGPKLVNNS